MVMQAHEIKPRARRRPPAVIAKRTHSIADHEGQRRLVSPQLKRPVHQEFGNTLINRAQPGFNRSDHSVYIDAHTFPARILAPARINKIDGTRH